jgi:hypothetical protein
MKIIAKRFLRENYLAEINHKAKAYFEELGLTEQDLKFFIESKIILN